MVIVIRDKEGKFKSVPEAKFYDGEVVSASEKHYSQKALCRLRTPTYNKIRGWLYIEDFMDLQNESMRGSSFWNNESMYETITDPILKLYANRIKLKSGIIKHESVLKQKREELGKIEYALSLAVEDWDKVKKKCKCGKLFIRNSKNINSDICDICDNQEA